jgi:hypothetical protein
MPLLSLSNLAIVTWAVLGAMLALSLGSGVTVRVFYPNLRSDLRILSLIVRREKSAELYWVNFAPVAMVWVGLAIYLVLSDSIGL